MITSKLSEKQLAVKDYILSYIQDKKNRAQSIDASYARLWEAIERLAAVDGKYIRPQIVFMAAEAYQSDISESDIIPAAASVELLHLAMLIHDDIIDRDDIRKGISNVSGQYLEVYEPFLKDPIEQRHFASSAALLAGDGLLAAANHVLLKTKVDISKLRQASELFDEAVFRVIGGELFDTETSIKTESKVSPLITAIEKTSSYSFCLPLQLGACLAAAPDADIKLLREIGTEVGIVFQLRDDELGVFGDSARLGKTVDGDLREGKWTYLVELHHQLASQDLLAKFKLGFRQPLASAEDIMASRNALEESGARQSLTKTIQKHCQQANNLIDKLNWPLASKLQLKVLLEKTATRTA